MVIFLMIVVRRRGGRNRIPTMSRFGARISRTCPTSTISMSVPSTGVASTHRRFHVEKTFVNLDERIAQPVHMGHGGDIVRKAGDSGDGLGSLEIETTSQIDAVHRHGSHPVHAAVAVHVPQVREVHGVLGRFLGMAGEPDRPEFHFAPVGPARRIFGKVPLRRPPAASPPSENQAENFPCLEHLQSGRSGCRGKGRGDALAGCIVFETVERADQVAVAYLPPRFRAQLGTQMRTYRLCHADAPLFVAPGDDLPTQPAFLDQLPLRYRLTTGDEIPAFGKRRKRGEVVTLALTCLHFSPASLVLTATSPPGSGSRRESTRMLLFAVSGDAGSGAPPGADVKHIPVLLVIMLVLAACARRDDPPPESFLQLERNTEFDGANLRAFGTLDEARRVAKEALEVNAEAQSGQR